MENYRGISLIGLIYLEVLVRSLRSNMTAKLMDDEEGGGCSG